MLTGQERPQRGKKAGLLDRFEAKLQGSRFRWLNEQLYTQAGSQALEMLASDPSMYQEYHQVHLARTGHCAPSRHACQPLSYECMPPTARQAAALAAHSTLHRPPSRLASWLCLRLHTGLGSPHAVLSESAVALLQHEAAPCIFATHHGLCRGSSSRSSAGRSSRSSELLHGWPACHARLVWWTLGAETPCWPKACPRRWLAWTSWPHMRESLPATWPTRPSVRQRLTRAWLLKQSSLLAARVCMAYPVLASAVCAADLCGNQWSPSPTQPFE